MRLIIVGTFVVSMLSIGSFASAEDSVSVKGLRAALDSPARSEQDRGSDKGRKPAGVIDFLGIAEGHTVIDLMAMSGYYTEALSIAVGETGTVYAQNPAAFLTYGDTEEQLAARLEGARLANVKRLDREFDAMGLEAGTVDAAVTVLNFHDIYNDDLAAAAVLLASVRTCLKRNGILGVIDHAGNPGGDNGSLHRVDEQKVIEAAMEAGFELAASSDLLRNTADERDVTVFDPGVRGMTDRFVLKFRSP